MTLAAVWDIILLLFESLLHLACMRRTLISAQHPKQAKPYLSKSFFNSLNHYPFNPVTSLVFYSLARSLEYHHFHPPISAKMIVRRGSVQSFRWLFGTSCCYTSYVISFNGSIMWSPIHSSATCRVHRVQCWSKSVCLLSKIEMSILWKSQCIIKHVLHVSGAWCI